MKTYIFFNRSLAAAAIVATSASMMFTSCQDDALDEIKTPVHGAEVMMTERNDSIFKNDFVFNYSNAGTTSLNQFVEDNDFAVLNTKGRQSRGIAYFTPTSVALNIMNFVGSAIQDNIKDKVGSTIVDAILGTGAGDMEALNEISGKIDAVSNMIENLTVKAEDDNIAKMYNDRMNAFTGLDLNNTSYFRAYYEAMTKGNKEEAKGIAKQWGREMVNGTSLPTATYNYMTMIVGTLSGSQMSMPEIYDYWVYRTTPWEHMGYQKREQLRISDVCIATTGYLMACAYFEQDSTSVGKNMMDGLTNAYIKFQDFYKDRLTVEHHNDVLVCQIKGAHIVFNKNIVTRDMKNHPWIENESEWNLEKMMYAEPRHDASYTLQRALTPDEAKAIYNYYNDGKTNKKSMLDIMKEVGFNVSTLTEGKTHIMTLNTGASTEKEHFWNNNYFLRFDKVVDVCNAENPWIDDLSIGKMWKTSERHHKYSLTRMHRWDSYDSDNKDFFRVDIDHRYTDMKAF